MPSDNFNTKSFAAFLVVGRTRDRNVMIFESHCRRFIRVYTSNDIKYINVAFNRLDLCHRRPGAYQNDCSQPHRLACS